MTILLLGSDYFHKALINLGCDVVRAGTDRDCELPMEEKDLDIPRIISRLGREPEAVILTDDLGRRIFPSGLERTSAPKVYYGVDGPLNLFWQKHFARLFDLVLLDQKSTVQEIPGSHWLPVGIDTSLYQGPTEEPQCDIGFVGVINPKVRPKRSNIISLLSEKFSLRTAGGRKNGWTSPQQAARLYRTSRMVLNENLFPGFTTRLLEGPASGTLAFTEKESPGLTDFFTPDKDLAVYSPVDIVDQARAYLSDSTKRKKIAARGREKVLTGHDVIHRAQALLDLTAKARPGEGVKSMGPFSDLLGKTLYLTGLRWPDHDGDLKLARAETLLNRALRSGAADEETFFYLGVSAIIKGDEPRGFNLLQQAGDSGSIRALVALGIAGDRGRLKAAARSAGLDWSEAEDRETNLHLPAGRILEKAGHDLTPGFSRWGLNPIIWDALEHYLAAAGSEPDRPEPRIRIGKMLAGRGAFCEAGHFLDAALALGANSPEIRELHNETRLKGYFSPLGGEQ